MITKYVDFNYNINNILEKFINNKIDSIILEDMLHKSLISIMNENLFTSISHNFDKWLLKIMSYIQKHYNNIKNKIVNILNATVNAISKFTKKHPRATKIIIILILIFIITIFTAQTAKAIVNGNVDDTNIKITNAMIGLIKEMMNNPNVELPNNLGMESIAYLIDFRDKLNHVGNPTEFILSDRAEIVVKSAKSVIFDIIENNKVDSFKKLVEVGEKYISYNITEIKTTSSSFSQILLGVK